MNKLKQKLKIRLKSRPLMLLFIKKLINHPFSLFLQLIYGVWITWKLTKKVSLKIIYKNQGIIKFNVRVSGNVLIGGYLFVDNCFLWKQDISLICDGEIDIHKSFAIGADTTLVVTKNAKLEIIGDEIDVNVIMPNSGITGRTTILCGKYIFIGAQSIIAWNVNIIDSDFHPINGVVGCKEVYIGNNVWIGNSVNILKGAYIPDGSIIGAGSIVRIKLTKKDIYVLDVGLKGLNRDFNWTRY